MVSPQKHPLHQLEPADLELVLRFVLASGSLKAVAKGYEVSYPTIRNRLDRLISRLESLVDPSQGDPFTAALAEFVARGRLDPHIARELKDLHEKENQA